MRHFIAAFAVVLAMLVPGVAQARLPLSTGAKGRAVCGAQWLLSGHKPSRFTTGKLAVRTYRLARPASRGAGCQYGRRMRRATRDAYWKLGWPAWYTHSPAAERYGPVLRDVLTGARPRPIAYRVAAGKRANRATVFSARSSTPVKVRRMVADARYLIVHRALVHYSQSNRMQIVRGRLNLPPLTRSIWEDCSSSTTGLYWLAHLPDPNDLGYAGYGYTGTQANHGRLVWVHGQSLTRLRPGDLIFYGRWPYRHVSMYLGAGLVFSHGSEGGPYLLPVLYRTDAATAHRYVGVP